ncbi:MAG: protein kinase domain-containing protein, partial [Isosphaeraceae bacterium]
APRRRGRDWLSGLDQAQSQAEPSLGVTSHGPARAFLARADYLASVCWIGACLADALQFAHQCGLVHLDIKPSNVLMAADGMPMLLDFHLARPPIDAGERVRRGLGGTPLYMSPEQRAAMREIHDGRPVTQAVDGRSDIYSLGLVLLQFLGGAISIGGNFSLDRDRSHLRRPAGVPVGLGDIIARCLAVDPRERYPDAAQLAEDLRRHLADLPLRGVRNRSLSERWRKWNRRHPQALVRAASTAMVAPVMIVAACVVAGADAHRRLQGAQSLLDDSRRQIDRRDYPAAVRDLRQGLALIDHPWVLVFDGHLARRHGLRRDLTACLTRARHLAMAEEIHGLADRLRFLYGAELQGSEPLRALEHHLRATGEARDRIVEQLAPELDPERAGRLRSDLLDLGILRANLRVRLAGGSDADARREALRTLDEAERSFGPSPVLACERQAHAQALGLLDIARAAAESRARMAPRTAWEHYAIGRSLMTAGSLEAAAAEFDRAIDLEPQDLWAQFSRGICAYRLRHHDTALRAFDVCVALAPDIAPCYYNRARAHAALGHTELARRDDEHARRLADGTALPLGSRRTP